MIRHIQTHRSAYARPHTMWWFPQDTLMSWRIADPSGGGPGPGGDVFYPPISVAHRRQWMRVNGPSTQWSIWFVLFYLLYSHL